MTLALLIDQHAASQKTAVCLKVTDLESGDVLFDRRGDQLMTPASNLKIYTTACASTDLALSIGFERRFVWKELWLRDI